MFARVLVANRGEVAVRIIRTLRRMGVFSVGVYAAGDHLAPHVGEADLAVSIGDDARAYLDAGRLIAAAEETGSDALHPGYGFLSENAGFARACAAAGVVFIGPPPQAIEAMGDKINAKRMVSTSGVPVVPGSDRAGLDDEQLAGAARKLGLPVLLKPSAGGGGKGMHLVTSEQELGPALESSRREAMAAFGEDTLLVERYLARPRHVEVQVFADVEGSCVALGERECSLQRRHQKIVEEAPSPLLGSSTRASMAASAVAAARACGYVGAGTVEFILSADRPDEYFFMEMNTRLQVEHPVTEMVLGIDLVEWQVRVAAGERLPWRSQSEVPEPRGHAVEARVYAEDPARGFLPSSGRVLQLRQPETAGPVRVDSGLVAGLDIATTYDPMLVKVVCWGPDRRSALTGLDRALADVSILGVTTNVAFIRRLLQVPEVQAGELDTGLVERFSSRPDAVAPPVTDAVYLAAALLSESDFPASTGPATADPWTVSDGWRVGGAVPVVSRWRLNSGSVEVARSTGNWRVDGRDVGPVRSWSEGDRYLVEVGGRVTAFDWFRVGYDVWLGAGGATWSLKLDRPTLERRAGPGHGEGRVTSPMPGTVLTLPVTTGQAVAAGDALVVVEAMKMEHTVRAQRAGTVAEVLVHPGDAVRLDQLLVLINEPAE